MTKRACLVDAVDSTDDQGEPGMEPGGGDRLLVFP